MKTLQDPRHKKREKKVKLLYAFSFRPKEKPVALIAPIVANLNSIDTMISKCASSWPVKQLNIIDLAILRLALFELLVEKNNPTKVIIDEAIELAKQYGSESSPKFVNGILGAVLKKLKAY